MPSPVSDGVPDMASDYHAASEWIRLAELSKNSFFNRRALEWKLAFGFWTGIAVITGALTGLPTLEGNADPIVKLAPGLLCALATIYLVVWLASLCCWQFPLQRGHSIDLAFYKYYTQQAEWMLLRKDTHKDAENGRPTRPTPHWMSGCMCSSNAHLLWLIGQAMFTVLFLILSFGLIAAAQFPQ